MSAFPIGSVHSQAADSRSRTDISHFVIRSNRILHCASFLSFVTSLYHSFSHLSRKKSCEKRNLQKLRKPDITRLLRSVRLLCHASLWSLASALYRALLCSTEKERDIKTESFHLTVGIYIGACKNNRKRHVMRPDQTGPQGKEPSLLSRSDLNRRPHAFNAK